MVILAFFIGLACVILGAFVYLFKYIYVNDNKD